MSYLADEKTLTQLSKLYPGLSDQELTEVNAVLTEYFQVAWEIYEESVLSQRQAQREDLVVVSLLQKAAKDTVEVHPVQNTLF